MLFRSNADNQEVTISTSNSAIATAILSTDQTGQPIVVVTGVAVGTANITITSVDNSQATATLPVTVTPAIIPVTSVALDVNSLELYTGEKRKLTATITPNEATNKKIMWSSSNSSIATVDDNGNVTAIASGQAIVTVTTEDGAKTATCEVIVKTKVESIDFGNTTSLAVVAGTSESVQYWVYPTNADNKEVTVSTSNSAIATATLSTTTAGSFIVVTGVAVGTANITVTSIDNPQAKATLEVTVTPAIITVTSVALDVNSLELYTGEKRKLTATITPNEATNKKIMWSSSNSSIATVDDNGNVTAIASGQAIVTVTTEDGAKTATCEVIVKTKVESIDFGNTTSITLEEGTSESVLYWVYPTNADNKEVTVSTPSCSTFNVFFTFS